MRKKCWVPLYVTWTDPFMSGWGKARNKMNRCWDGPFDSVNAAQVEYYVRTHARTLPANRISVTLYKPRPSLHTLVSHVRVAERAGARRMRRR